MQLIIIFIYSFAYNQFNLLNNQASMNLIYTLYKTYINGKLRYKQEKNNEWRWELYNCLNTID